MIPFINKQSPIPNKKHK